MKNVLSALALVLCCAAAAVSQEKQRYFDNFDTSRGVAVQPGSRQLIPIAARSRSAKGEPSQTRTSTTKKPKTVATAVLAASPLVKKTAQATPRVPIGSAERSLRPSNVNAGKHLRGYSTGDQLIDGFIVDSSRRYNIDPLLIYAQMSQESSFKRRALSHKGASGLMQLMPATARRLGVTNIYDPKQNIEGGVKYMRMLLDMFGSDVDLALAGYNAGEGAVMKYGRQIPPYNETRDYVRRISARYRSISSGAAANGPAANGVRSSIPTQVAGSTGRRMLDPQTMVIRTSDGKTHLVR